MANTPKFYALERERLSSKQRSPLDIIGSRRAGDAELGQLDSPNANNADGDANSDGGMSAKNADSVSLMK